MRAVESPHNREQTEGRRKAKEGGRLISPSFFAQGLASTQRPGARHYISGVSATAPIPFDVAHSAEDLKRRFDGARPVAARAAGRKQQARWGWGGAAIDEVARDLKPFFPRIAGFSATRLRGVRRFCESGTAPDFLVQTVRQGGRKAGCSRGSRVLKAVNAGHVGRHDPRSQPAEAGTGAPAGGNATGSALDVIRVDGVTT